MADEAVVKGGPDAESDQVGKDKGKGSDQGSAAPQRVKMKVGDREIEVDEGVAVLLEEQQRGFQEYQGQVNRYIRQLTQQPAAKPDKKDDAPPSFFDDPEGFMAHHLQQSEERLKGYVNETFTKTQKKQNEREFWSEFYEDNHDLRGAEMIVEAVFQRNLDTLADMKVSQAKSELSRRARAELERMLQSRQKPGEGAGEGNDEGDQRSMRQVVVGAGARGPGKGGTKAGEGADDGKGKQPATLGAVLKARRAARMPRRGTQH